MTNRKIALIAVAVAMLHFVVTVVATRYVAFQIGAQMGRSVAGFLADATQVNPSQSGKSVDEKHSDMTARNDSIIADWQTVLVVLSLPTRPLLDPPFRQFDRQQIKRVLAKEITMEQARTTAIITDITKNFLNSVSLGLLLFFTMRVIRHYMSPRRPG
jgi:hypothetical protein